MPDYRKNRLVLVDETMADELATYLLQDAVAASATGWRTKILRCPRAEPGTPSWVEKVIKVGNDIRSEYAKNPFQAIVIYGAVAKPYSGNARIFNGNHFNGSALADMFYATPTIPVERWTSQDKISVAQGPSQLHANYPNDGKWDISALALNPTTERIDGSWGSLQSRTTRPIPLGRIDASRLGTFGVSDQFTPSASPEEINLIKKYIERSVAWRLGTFKQLPRRVIWDNAFTPNPKSNPIISKNWEIYGTIELTKIVGDNSQGTSPTNRVNYRPPAAIACSAQTGGGWGGSGTYLNYGPWNSDPSRRVLDSTAFTYQPPIQVAIWDIYGSYVYDTDATRALPRCALLQPDGCGIFVNPPMMMAINDKNITFGDLLNSNFESIAKNPNNDVFIFFYHVGDVTLPLLPSSKEILMADLNYDGIVDFSDLLLLAKNYNVPGNFSEGDITGDGMVDFGDLLFISANYNKSINKYAWSNL